MVEKHETALKLANACTNAASVIIATTLYASEESWDEEVRDDDGSGYSNSRWSLLESSMQNLLLKWKELQIEERGGIVV